MPWKWAYCIRFSSLQEGIILEFPHLKGGTKGRNRRSVKIVCLSCCRGFRELPELVIVVLDPNQRGDHGECSMEGSVRPGVDQQLVSEGSPVTGAGNVDIVHVSGWDLLTNLGNQIQDELDVISLALLSINIPETITILSRTMLDKLYQLLS